MDFLKNKDIKIKGYITYKLIVYFLLHSSDLYKKKGFPKQRIIS